MQELLSELIGRKLEVFCGASSLRGEVRQVKDGLLHLEGDKHLNYVAIDKITFVREVGDDERQAGFVAAPGES